MMYGTCIMIEPFFLSKSPIYRDQIMLQNKNRRFNLYNNNIYSNILLKNASSSSTPTIRILQERIRPMMPLREEKMLLTLSFMLCVAVGIAIFLLGSFHIYLILTAQTTIEFHGNINNKRKMKQLNNNNNKKWQNPYSLNNNYKLNWSQIYGKNSGTNIVSILISLLPSNREPDYYPAPIPGNSLRPLAISSSLSLQQQQTATTKNILYNKIDNQINLSTSSNIGFGSEDTNGINRYIENNNNNTTTTGLNKNYKKNNIKKSTLMEI